MATRCVARGARSVSSTSPQELLRRFYFDSVVFEPKALTYLVDLVGAEHVFLGTDAPFDMGDEDPMKTIADAPGLTDEQRAQIAGRTALGSWAKLRRSLDMTDTGSGHSLRGRLDYQPIHRRGGSRCRAMPGSRSGPSSISRTGAERPDAPDGAAAADGPAAAAGRAELGLARVRHARRLLALPEALIIRGAEGELAVNGTCIESTRRLARPP